MFAHCNCCTIVLCFAGLLPARAQDAPYPPQPAPESAGQEVPPPPSVLPPTNSDVVAPQPPPHPLDAYQDPVFPDHADVFTHRNYWPEVWGFAGINVFATGKKMAPNGLTYYPLGSLFADINIGILPQKRLYIFGQSVFWVQKPTSGVTNGDQGNLDFSKRQMDLTLGAAWRYYGPLEFRAFAFSFSNLNRGFDLNVPARYNDGFGIENRYYIFKSNAYDLPRLNFLSIGYMPTKEITGLDGNFFKPGFFARAYLTYEFVPRRYYVYADSQLICQQFAEPKLLFFDDGFAARPFDKLTGLEFRLGVTNTVDVQVHRDLTLVYALFQVLF